MAIAVPRLQEGSWASRARDGGGDRILEGKSPLALPLCPVPVDQVSKLSERVIEEVKEETEAQLLSRFCSAVPAYFEG